MYEVAASAITLTRTFALANSDRAGRPGRRPGHPQLPDRDHHQHRRRAAWVPSKQDNMSRGGFRDGQR